MGMYVWVCMGMYAHVIMSSLTTSMKKSFLQTKCNSVLAGYRCVAPATVKMPIDSGANPESCH